MSILKDEHVDVQYVKRRISIFWRCISSRGFRTIQTVHFGLSRAWLCLVHFWVECFSEISFVPCNKPCLPKWCRKWNVRHSLQIFRPMLLCPRTALQQAFVKIWWASKCHSVKMMMDRLALPKPFFSSTYFFNILNLDWPPAKTVTHGLSKLVVKRTDVY